MILLHPRTTLRRVKIERLERGLLVAHAPSPVRWQILVDLGSEDLRCPLAQLEVRGGFASVHFDILAGGSLFVTVSAFDRGMLDFALVLGEGGASRVVHSEQIDYQ